MKKARPTIRNSEIVRAKIALFSGQLGFTAARLWSHPQFPLIYREYIFQSHSIIRASVPLMQAAEQACAKRCHTEGHEDDPVLQEFAHYLHRHIPEETGHHEWILDDGEALGLKRTAILERAPKESALQLVGGQYYWIHHYNPIALAGYIATMEGSPDPVESIEALAKRSKLPLECFSSFLYHAKIDHRHRRELDDVLDSLPLTSAQLELIGISSLRTIRLMTEILEDIIGSARSK